MATLGRQELESRLNAGEIFLPSTWELSCLWEAKYDLRIATDYMVIPGTSDGSERVYPREEHREEAVILGPGEMAFFSTAERMCLPRDVLGIVGPKFTVARRGLLVLTGSVVDPGYGLVQADDGGWSPNPDERLHFVVANLSRRQIALKPGVDRIASVFFSAVSGNAASSATRPIRSSDDVHREFFRDSALQEAGLAFFHELRGIKEHVDKRFHEVKSEVDRVDGAVQVFEKGSSQLIYFGVFLLGVSLIGVAGAFILAFLETDAVGDLAKTARWPAAVVALSAAAVVSAVCWMIVSLFARRASGSKP